MLTCYGPSLSAIRRGPLMLFKELSGKDPDLKQIFLLLNYRGKYFLSQKTGIPQPLNELKLLSHEQQLPKHFRRSNANVSIFLVFYQNNTQIMNQYYKYLIHGYLLKILVKSKLFQLFFLYTPKENPADKQYIPQKHLQLNTVAAYMCCSQSG